MPDTGERWPGLFIRVWVDGLPNGALKVMMNSSEVMLES
jgi:hypothetical protein